MSNMSNLDLLKKIEVATEIINHYAPEIYWWRLTMADKWYEKYHNASQVLLQHAFGIDIALPTYVNKMMLIVESSCETIETDVKTMRDLVEKKDFSNGDFPMDTYEKVCDNAILTVAKFKDKIEFFDRVYPNSAEIKKEKEKKVKAFMDFLENHVDVKIEKKDYRDFQDEFAELYEDAYLPEDRIYPSHQGRYALYTIDFILMRMNSGYSFKPISVKGEMTYWIIKKKKKK